MNPNYRLGYVQIRNLDIQQQIRPTLLLNIDYTGTKGTDLDILEAPNRTADRDSHSPESTPSPTKIPWPIRKPTPDRCGCASAWPKDSPSAASTHFPSRSMMLLPSARAQPRERTLRGWARAAPARAVEAAVRHERRGAANVAQNPFDLSAERGLSSFNQTHKFTADYLLELPFGHDKRWLTGNTPWRAILGDWQWSGDWTIASGLPSRRDSSATSAT